MFRLEYIISLVIGNTDDIKNYRNPYYEAPNNGYMDRSANTPALASNQVDQLTSSKSAFFPFTVIRIYNFSSEPRASAS